VYIVAKGNVAGGRHTQPVIRAGTLRNQNLTWSQAHLLDFHYDVAHIKEFRNLWALDEIQDVGSLGERDYLVEIRLVPSSPEFSLLTPDGGFRRKH
jgi:hypothetical protein